MNVPACVVDGTVKLSLKLSGLEKELVFGIKSRVLI